MPLVAGQRFGAFEVLAPLGAGGMGEVWRARDPRLGREVALKVLPADFANDPARVARFDREARVLAGLNHPGIATIHGFEQAEGLSFLVLELVGGEPLSERIRRGPLAADVALHLAGQIAEALAAAHARGVIHRDLKPANVMVTPEGRSKVLDFGLAKEIVGPLSPNVATDSPTVTRSPSAAGLVLGTPAYMSPEQARGHEVDRRSDIWSLGCMLYEMLAGRRTFQGPTSSDTLAAVLTHEPDWDALPPTTPPLLRSLLRRCLQKDPDRRWHDAADVRIEIDEALAEPSSTARASLPHSNGGTIGTRRLGWGALALGGFLVGLVAWHGMSTPPATHPSRTFELAIPAAGSLLDEGYEDRGLALSPDGRYLALTVVGGDQNPTLYVQDLQSPSPSPVLRVEDGWDPFFSPDSAWLGYYVHGERSLRALSLKGGPPKVLCTVNDLRGGSWSTDGSIVFSDLTTNALSVVSSEGGERKPLTQVEDNGPALAHRWPSPLPGGRHVLFGVVPRSGREEDSQVAEVEIATGRTKVLVRGVTQPRYRHGWLLYVRNGVVMGAPFDPERGAVLGAEKRILDDEVFSVPKVGMAYYDLAGDLLVYVPRIQQSPDRQIVELDRQGRTKILTSTKRAYTKAIYSPDGRKLAVTIQSGPDTDLWVVDRASDSWSRLIEGGDIDSVLWHPDGQRLVVRSKNRQPPDVLLVRVDGSAPPERIFEHRGLRGTHSFSPDGRWLVVTLDNPATQADIFLLDLKEGGGLHPFLQTIGWEVGGLFSPDGRWIAYIARNAGKDELFLAPFPGPGLSHAIGPDADGYFWPGQDHELFLWKGTSVLAASFDTTAGLLKEPFRPAFSLRVAPTSGADASISPDGQRLAYVPDDPSAKRLRLVAISGFRLDEPSGRPAR